MKTAAWFALIATLAMLAPTAGAIGGCGSSCSSPIPHIAWICTSSGAGACVTANDGSIAGVTAYGAGAYATVEVGGPSGIAKVSWGCCRVSPVGPVPKFPVDGGVLVTSGGAGADVCTEFGCTGVLA